MQQSRLDSYQKVYRAFKQAKTIKHTDVRRIAKTVFGHPDPRKGNTQTILEYIRTHPRVSRQQTPTLPQPVASLTPAVPMSSTLESWPLPPTAFRDKTVAQLKAILERHGVRTGLPRTKDELLSLFTKRRCNATDSRMACGDDDICDLRNNLCRSVAELRKKQRPHGIDQMEHANHLFWGDKRMLAQLRLPRPPAVSDRSTTTASVRQQGRLVRVEPDVASSASATSGSTLPTVAWRLTSARRLGMLRQLFSIM